MREVSRFDRTKKLGLCVSLLSILIIGARCPVPIHLKPFDQVGFQTLLASLLAIALFLERGVEVFVVTWKAPGAEDIKAKRLGLNKEIEHLKDDLQKVETRIADLIRLNSDTTEALHNRNIIIDTIKNKEKDVIDNERDEITYASGTKRFALYFALAGGLLISAVGVRVLDALTVMGPGNPDVESYQKFAIQMVDIALTQ